MKHLLILTAFFILSGVTFAQEADSLGADSDRYAYQTGDHELFLMPTAHTMPARQTYLGSYEVVLLNFTVAVSPSTHLGLYVLPIPAYGSFKGGAVLTLLAKHNYYNTPAFSGAAWGMVNINGAFLVVGNTFSYETDIFGFHGGFGYARADLENKLRSQGVILLGANAKICGWLRAIAEYSNTPSELYNAKDHFTGLGMAGLRYRDRHFVLDVAAGKLFGPVNNDIFPLVKAVVYF